MTSAVVGIGSYPPRPGRSSLSDGRQPPARPDQRSRNSWSKTALFPPSAQRWRARCTLSHHLSQPTYSTARSGTGIKADQQAGSIVLETPRANSTVRLTPSPAAPRTSSASTETRFNPGPTRLSPDPAPASEDSQRRMRGLLSHQAREPHPAWFTGIEPALCYNQRL